MLESSALIAFAATTDLERARGFYQGTLGLRLVEQNPYACVFDAAGSMLRVTAVAEVARAGYTVLGWRVTDIEDRVRELAERGVETKRYDGMGQDANGIWRAPGGDRIAWFSDPDGNTLSLTELET
jgi:catechol 2,3-dioxygenase-like lactoylglutathione lyase family enzyme